MNNALRCLPAWHVLLVHPDLSGAACLACPPKVCDDGMHRRSSIRAVLVTPSLTALPSAAGPECVHSILQAAHIVQDGGRLAALAPPPRMHLTRFHGVFGIEIECCARCGGELRILASIEQPEVIAKILSHLQRIDPGQYGSELPLGARSPPATFSRLQQQVGLESGVQLKGLLGHLLRVQGGRQPAQSRLWSLLVVSPSPGFDHCPCVSEADKPVLAQILVPRSTIERLDVSILVRFAAPTLAAELGDGGTSMAGVGVAEGAWLRQRAYALPAAGNTLIVTHVPNLRAAVGTDAGDVADGESLVFGRDADGTVRVLARIPVERWATVVRE